MDIGNPLKFRSAQVKLDFNNVLIIPRRSDVCSRRDVDLDRSFTFVRPRQHAQHWKGVPIISSNMDTVTGIESFDVLRRHNFLSCFPKHLNEAWTKTPDAALQHTDNYMLSCGTGEDDFKTMVELLETLRKNDIRPKFLCVDVANGYISHLKDVCKEFRRAYPDLVLAAGNVVTPEGVEDLVKSGASIVKVGIGSSGVCETRLKAGVGYPQLSAVLECAPVAHRMGANIISDGGVVYPADISKAFVAGADFVMMGSMFAGHTESPGEVLLDPATKKWYKAFYGMASKVAADKYSGGLRDYRTSEGKAVKIPYKGALQHTIQDIEGSVRSACTYTNARNLEELCENGQFALVSETHNKAFK